MKTNLQALGIAIFLSLFLSQSAVFAEEKKSANPVEGMAGSVAGALFGSGSNKSAAVPAPEGSQKVKKMDTDNDGYKESHVFYEGNKVVKVLCDKNRDGKVDVTVYYKNGCRNTAEIDANFDGKTDTFMNYYFTGVPSAVRMDTNKDGKPDYWQYFKNGFIYKKEWDRNKDGNPDYRVTYDVKSDFRVVAESEDVDMLKEYDEDFDGVFEKSVKTKETLTRRVRLAPGDIQEIQAD